MQKMYPSDTVCNGYPMLMKLHDWVDMKKLSDSLMKTVQAHPSCLSLIEERNGTPIQKYIPDLITDIKIEKVSEAEFQSMRNNLLQPFDLFKDAPFRLRLFETEQAKYFFFDYNHVFSDGFGWNIFFSDLEKIYSGEEIEKDCWFSYLDEWNTKNTPPQLSGKQIILRESLWQY